VKWNASEAQKAVAACFKNAEKEFRKDLALTPIHIAVLDIYDISDMDRLGNKPGLSELLKFAAKANNAISTEDWSELESMAENRSPLFREVLDRHQGREIGKKEYHDLLNECDAINEWSPLHWAAYTGRLKELKVLLDSGPEVTITKSGRNLLHHATESGNSEMVAYLVENRYNIDCLDIDLADTWKETPLHIAAYGNASSVSSLIDAGANVDVYQKDHQTPLHYAARAEDPERPKIVALLADKSISCVNAKDDEGCTPIFSFLGTPPCLKLLMQKGAKLEIRDKQRRTLLHHACREDQPESLTLLLTEVEKSAIAQKDRHGLTPLDEALGCESVDCAKLILRNHPTKAWKDQEAGSLLLRAARLGDSEFLKLVLGLSLVDHRSFVDRAAAARKAACEKGSNKGEVEELLDELNRKRARVVREAQDHIATQVTYLAMR
jgi:ankyrin repeat protein